ncbi:MAG: molybdopterin-dependent oxidoreductase [Deltaproteobacteria bacterium]|nr:molybdopterin-dependent oxidoreductase [Deltaproteobacteria bacterium]MBW2392762.1 molybdopterin-dependent oxidoreductase [Deltaproteobacteria bacterium]
MCGLRIEVQGCEIKRIEGDPDDPYSRGALCPKAIALGEIQNDPDRLKKPLRRRGADWEEISWEAALEETAERIAGIQRKHGDDAVALYVGNPAAHSFGILFGLTPFTRALGTRSRYSASSLDQNPKHASSLLLFGHWLHLPIPDVERTSFMLMLGANPVVSGGSLMSAPRFSGTIRRLQERGGRLVVVDPRRSETAKLADEHWFIRPGADGWLLAALVHTVLDEKLGRESPAGARTDGREALAETLAPFAPEAVEATLGIDAGRVRALARAFAAAPSAVCYGRIGTCVHPFGTLNSWLVDVLNLLTGNLDRVGGAMFPHPALDLAGMISAQGGTGELNTGRTRVRGAPIFNGDMPTACLAEEIEAPGQGQVRGLITVAGNPVLSAPNGARLGRAMQGLSFYAAVDFYLNETTRHADLILPPSWSLEHDNYEALFHGFAIRNTAKFSPAALSPEPGQLDDFELLAELGLRLGARKGGALRKFALGLLRGRVPSVRTLLDLALRAGPHGDGFRPWRSGLRLRDLEASPSGIDFGPLGPGLDRILCTPDGRIDLAPTAMRDELTRLANELAAPSEQESFRLIGRRDVRTCNTWIHNTRVGTKGRERCTLLMHPDDASKLGLADEQTVRISSRVGKIEAPLELSSDLMPGVVSLPHGWGHHGPGLRMAVAEAHPGVSCNDLVDDAVLEPVVGNAVFNGVPVRIEAAD